MTDPADLTIPEAASALRAGTLTARGLTAAALARIRQRNPQLHAVTHLNPDALTEADRADAMLAAGIAGPLCGIPFLVKDLIDVADLPPPLVLPCWRAALLPMMPMPWPGCARRAR